MKYKLQLSSLCIIVALIFCTNFEAFAQTPPGTVRPDQLIDGVTTKLGPQNQINATPYAPRTVSLDGSGNYTILQTDCYSLLKLPTSAGAAPTITLPNINPAGGGCLIKVQQMTSTAYTVAVASGGTLTSPNSYTLTAQNQIAEFDLNTASTTAAGWTWNGPGTPVNVPGTLTGAGNTVTAIQNGPQVVASPGITINGASGLTGATIQVTAGFKTGDLLNFTNQQPNWPNVTGLYNTSTGILTLSGADTVAHWQSALQSVAFQTTDLTSLTSRTISWLVTAGSSSSPTVTSTVNITIFPLTVTSNVLLTAGGKPFIMVGDAPQGSVINIPPTGGGATFATYIADRKQQGFNTVWITAICEAYITCPDTTADVNGALPFASQLSGTFNSAITTSAATVTCPNTSISACYDLSTASSQTAYWTHIDSVISQATANNFLILFNIMPTDGCVNPNSWLQGLYNNSQSSVAKIDSYATFITGRYGPGGAHYSPNIIWMIGNDYQPTTLSAWGLTACVQTAADTALLRLANDIKADITSPAPLVIGEIDPTALADTLNAWSSVFALNSIALSPGFVGGLLAYSQNSTTIPRHIIELAYLGEEDGQYDTTGTIAECSQTNVATGTRNCSLRERHQFWWSMFSGTTAGYVNGNHYTWQLGSGGLNWTATGAASCNGGTFLFLDTAANCQVVAGGTFLKNYSFSKFVPDATFGGSAIASPFVTACYGVACSTQYPGGGANLLVNNNWIASGSASDGSFGMAYVPGMASNGTIGTALSLTVNMNKVTGGTNLTAAWYDPSSTMTTPFQTICSPTGPTCNSLAGFPTVVLTTPSATNSDAKADWVLVVI